MPLVAGDCLQLPAFVDMGCPDWALQLLYRACGSRTPAWGRCCKLMAVCSNSLPWQASVGLEALGTGSCRLSLACLCPAGACALLLALAGTWAGPTATVPQLGVQAANHKRALPAKCRRAARYSGGCPRRRRRTTAATPLTWGLSLERSLRLPKPCGQALQVTRRCSGWRRPPRASASSTQNS